MTEAMETSSNGNTQAVSGMLETMLSGSWPSWRTLRRPDASIHEQMDRSMGAMTTVQQALQKLVEDINRSNEQAANRLSGTLEDAMKQSAANQQLLTDQMRQFVEDFRKLVTDEQDKSKRTMDEAVSSVLSQLATAVEQLETTRRTAASQEQSRNRYSDQPDSELVGGLSGQVEELLKSMPSRCR